MTFFKRLDTLTAIGASAVGLIIILFSTISTTNRIYLGIALIAPSVLYIAVQRTSKEKNKSVLDLKFRFPYYAQSILGMSFFSLYAYMIYVAHKMLYDRSLQYFILVTIAVTIIIIQIISNQHKNWNWIIIIEIMLVTLSICASVYYLFPTVYGIDPVYHLNFAQSIAELSFIPHNYGAYSQYPIMHLLISIVNILTGQNWKDTFFIMTIISTFSSIFIYLIGIKLFGDKVALFATLLYSVSNFHLYWSFWIAGTTIGSILVLILTYFIISNIKKEPKRQNTVQSLVILLFLLLVMSHTMSTVVFLWFLIMIFISRLVYIMISENRIKVILDRVQNFYSSSGRVKDAGQLKNCIGYSLLTNKFVSISLITLFFVFTLVYWTYNSSIGDVSFTENIGRILKNCFYNVELGNTESVSLASEYDLLEVTLSELGYAIYISIGLYGLLWSLFKDNSNAERFSLDALVISIFFIIYSAGILGFYAIMPHRWFIFLYMFLCFFTAIGLFNIISLFRERIIKWLFIVIISGIMIFFMVTGSYANSDSPIYTYSLTDRYGATSSELYASQWINYKYDGMIITDYDYGKYFSNSQYLNPEVSKEYDMVVLREHILLKWITVPVSGGYYVTRHINLPKNFEKSFEEVYNRIYNSEKVKSYAGVE